MTRPLGSRYICREVSTYDKAGQPIWVADVDCGARSPATVAILVAKGKPEKWDIEPSKGKEGSRPIKGRDRIQG
jgi:hypothetical protein